jgi:superfamily I DNA/RNA helicase
MARMVPNQLSPDTRSDAERLLYEAFRDRLEDDYIVFHSAAWLSQDRQGRPRDGEADFVIAHPQRGILVMEAKDCTTIHSFKGLERAVIILAGIGQRLTQEDHDLNSLLYVGCSRARHHLIVLMPEKAGRRVRKVFAAGDV